MQRLERFAAARFRGQRRLILLDLNIDALGNSLLNLSQRTTNPVLSSIFTFSGIVMGLRPIRLINFSPDLAEHFAARFSLESLAIGQKTLRGGNERDQTAGIALLKRDIRFINAQARARNALDALQRFLFGRRIFQIHAHKGFLLRVFHDFVIRDEAFGF